jgi:hypothetical protein
MLLLRNFRLSFLSGKHHQPTSFQSSACSDRGHATDKVAIAKADRLKINPFIIRNIEKMKP